VALVKKVYYNEQGNPANIDIVEYNYGNKYDFGTRTISASEPTAYIHILAYEEGVSGLNYLDCLEQSELCKFQSKREWEMINQKVWNDYRCTDCVSQYNSHRISAIANNMGGKGGGPGYQSTPDPQETESPNLPDFIVKKVILKNGQGNLFLAFYNNHRKLRIETILSKTSEKPIGRETNITCT